MIDPSSFPNELRPFQQLAHSLNDEETKIYIHQGKDAYGFNRLFVSESREGKVSYERMVELFRRATEIDVSEDERKLKLDIPVLRQAYFDFEVITSHHSSGITAFFRKIICALFCRKSSDDKALEVLNDLKARIISLESVRNGEEEAKSKTSILV